MRQLTLLLVSIIITSATFAQAVTKNGQITSTSSSYVSANGAIGASTGVDKNGKVQTGLSVGSSYLGGKIFYFFVPGDVGYVAGETHGLIAANADLADAYWGCIGTPISGTRSEVGYGNANTNLIIAGCTTVGIAAQACANLVSNGQSDWYLPSINELLILMVNGALIGGLSSGQYVSSSQKGESGFNAANFYLTSDPTNKVIYDGQKSIPSNVRPIRSF